MDKVWEVNAGSHLIHSALEFFSFVVCQIPRICVEIHVRAATQLDMLQQSFLVRIGMIAPRAEHTARIFGRQVILEWIRSKFRYRKKRNRIKKDSNQIDW